MDVYNKIGFKDRIDTKPSSYLVDGEVKRIEKDNSGVKQEGSNLNAENLNHMDNGIFQNSQNIKTLNDTITKQGDSIGDLNTQYEDLTKELKENTTKNITKETNVLSLANNVDGIANISLGGNTIDIAKDPIISDFKGKTQGNTNDNPNAFKIGFNNSLLSPDNGGFEEKAQEEYNKIYSLDDSCSHSGTNVNGKFPQMLFLFNIVDVVERKIGKIQGNNTQEKVAWLKKNTKSITCNWWGYGSCPSGNKIYMKNYDGGKYGNYTCEHFSNTVSKLTYKASNLNLYNLSDGFMYFTVYTDASDGKTQSNIYTDYINLEVQLNPILQSVGEENKEIVVKSVGKNLINNDWNKWNIGENLTIETLGDNTLKIKNSSKDRNNFVWKKINVKANTDYVISFNVVRPESDLQGGCIWVYEDYCFGNILVTTNKNTTFNTKNNNEIIVGLYSSTQGDMTYKNIQLEEGAQVTEYEPYKEDEVTVNLLQPLRGLPNSTRDTINSDGSNTIRVGKVVLNGSENWTMSSIIKTNTLLFMVKDCVQYKVETVDSLNLYCDKFEPSRVYDSDIEGLFGAGVNNAFYIRINKSKLSTQDVDGFKKWLKENPTTVYYETNCILTGNKSPALALKTFKGGHIIVDTEVAPFITVNYPSNINSRIDTVENATSFMKDSLGGAWRTLLILADRELKMHSIDKLTTTDALSKKINEIIGVW